MTSADLTPTGHLTALAPPGEVADWRLVFAWEALYTQGVIDALPASAAHLAERLGVDVDAVHALLSIVAHWELVRCDGERWEVAPGALAPEEAAELARHANWIRGWARGLGPRLRDRSAAVAPPEAPAKPKPGINLDSLAHASAHNIAPVVDTCLQLASGAKRVLDLGGGHGRYAEEFARRGCEVTLQDLPPVIDSLRTKPHCESIELHAGDALSGVVPGPFDLIACCTVMNMFGPDDCARLIGNAVGALAPCGRFVVVSFMRDRSVVGAIFGAQMLVATPAGDAYESATYAQWLTEAGLEDVRVGDIAGTNLSTVVGQKP